MNDIILKEDFKLFIFHLTQKPEEAYHFFYNEKKYSTLIHLLRHRKNQAFIKKAAHYLIDNFSDINLNEKDISGSTSLFLAMPLKDEELIEKMIKMGADIYHKTPLGLNLLFLAIEHQYPQHFVLNLLERKISVKDTDIFGHSIFTKYKQAQYQENLKAIQNFKSIEKEKTDLEALINQPVLNSLIMQDEKKRKKI